MPTPTLAHTHIQFLKLGEEDSLSLSLSLSHSSKKKKKKKKMKRGGGGGTGEVKTVVRGGGFLVDPNLPRWMCQFCRHPLCIVGAESFMDPSFRPPGKLYV